MSKKTLLHYAAPAIVTGMLFAAVAVSWDEPGSNPPAGNTPAPINVSVDGQYKEGKLNVGNTQIPDATFVQLEVRGGGALRTVGGAILNTGGAVDGLVVANGNVGIGAASPGQQLYLTGNSISAAEVLLEHTGIGGSAGISFNVTRDASDFRIATHDNRLKFFVNGNRAMIILPNENVGIGAYSPTQKLEVNGGMKLNTADARPACDVDARGTFWFTRGAGAMGVPGTKDSVEVCVKDTLGNGVWFTIY
ncbi:hypothetical protein KAI56_03990 [Candidatus Parcubacteria bacterium]|nr:hypothetical protein [Candidatus Parcubacteria bacterium]